jgi:hypothetical protein
LPEKGEARKVKIQTVMPKIFTPFLEKKKRSTFSKVGLEAYR